MKNLYVTRCLECKIYMQIFKNSFKTAIKQLIPY